MNRSDRTAGRLAGVAFVALLIWAYAYRIGFLPPRWEEPRRCIIAFEMVASGNYVVPTIFGEIYAKKPPLQNWLVALFSGFDVGRIQVDIIRWMSVASVLGIALLLVALARGRDARWPWLAGAIFLTLGVMIQYGRSGEIDPLFTLWITAAFFFYEVGRRRDNPWLRWVPSQLMVALGVLTKGLSPLFFYPPILILFWLEARSTNARPAPRHRGVPPLLRAAPFLVGLALAGGIVAAWLVPYALRGSLAALRSTGSDEVLARTPLGGGMGFFLRGLALYPVEIVANLLPWSLFVAALLRRDVRARVAQAVRTNPYLRLSLAVLGWSFVMLWFMPGAKSRYLMPAFPFFAAALAALIEQLAGGRAPARGHGWWRMLGPALAIAWTLVVLLGGRARADVPMAAPLAVGLVAIAIVSLRRGDLLRAPDAVLAALLAGFLYAAGFAAIVEPSKAPRIRGRTAGIPELALLLEQDAKHRGWDPATVPVACDREATNAACFTLMQSLSRPLARPPLPARGGYVLAHPRSSKPPAGVEVLASRGSAALWRIAPADAASVTTQVPPPARATATDPGDG